MKFPISAIFFFTLVVAAVATNSFQRTLNKTRRNAINDDLNQNHAGVSNVEAKKITKRALDEEKHNPILERAAPFRNKLRDGFLRKDLSGKHHLELNEVSEETKNGDAEPLDLKVIFGGPYENLGRRVRREARKADSGTSSSARDFLFRNTTDSEDKATIVIIMVILICLLITYYYCICCVSIYYFKCQYCFDFDCYKRPGYPCPGKAERPCC